MNPNNQSTKPRLLQNWISLSGIVVAAGSLFAFLLLFALDTFQEDRNPYIGILAYVVAPGIAIFGAALAVVGAWIQRRHSRKTDTFALHPITIDVTRPRDRKFLFIFALGTSVFLFLTALASYKTYHFSESVQFCGQTCHVPMKPEFTTHQISPHANVDCTACHVGEGMDAYVKAKLNGVHQLVGVLSGNFDRPIKTPVKHMRQASETCEACHWPQRSVGHVEKVFHHFLMDETNTPFSVRMLLNVGGGSANGGNAGGIHAHMNLDNKVEYIATDERRQVIPWVRQTDSNGVVTVYKTADFKDENLSKYEIRRMDCLDCHNRPAHKFSPPNDSVDIAMAAGKIDSSLTWIKSNAVAVLTAHYTSEEDALQKISGSLRATYSSYPKLDNLVAQVQGIYKKSFFPEMKADWRAYPDNIGHKNWQGCFRCHDGNHKAEGSKQMIQAKDCKSCHTILAQGSAADMEKLNPKGNNFFHIDSNMEDFSCTECHTGGMQKE
jgi:hypothetical protein